MRGQCGETEVPPIVVLTSEALSECLGYHRCPRNWGPESHARPFRTKEGLLGWGRVRVGGHKDWEYVLVSCARQRLGQGALWRLYVFRSGRGQRCIPTQVV